MKLRVLGEEGKLGEVLIEGESGGSSTVEDFFGERERERERAPPLFARHPVVYKMESVVRLTYPFFFSETVLPTWHYGSQTSPWLQIKIICMQIKKKI